MVARGAGAAGPVLLACRQWDPLGLARRLLSLGVGAWRSAPLLPWRVQCPVRVCAALAAGLGGSGRYLVLCLSRFPHPALRVPLVRHSTRSVRSASSVRLPFWYSPRALCVCVRSHSRGVRFPPPWVVWRAHLARSRHWALVGPFHVVRAPQRVLPRSLAPSGVLGGGRSGPGSPLPCCGCRGVRAWGPVTNPTARALASWLCALWGRHKGARGGRLLPGYEASGVGRSPTPDCPPSGRAAGAHYPLAVGAGGCGRGDPSPTPQRALLRAVGAA